MIKDNIIERLKNDIEQIHRYKDATDNYGIRVLGRGENLFFQKNDKALICEIDAGNGLIFHKTIKKWDNGSKINQTEKLHILEKLLFLYQKFYNDKAKLFP